MAQVVQVVECLPSKHKTLSSNPPVSPKQQQQKGVLYNKEIFRVPA
jgi:hypothetical protein